MIHWKMSVLSIALGAAATAGFVWLGRRPRRRAPSEALPTADTGGDGRANELPIFDANEAARADALHDLDVDIFDVEQTELELGEPEAIDAMNAEGVEIRSLDEEPLSSDEPYDAVDPESMGNEFLRRAIDSPSPEAAPESLFDTSGDTAPELPVGNVQPDGTTELHEQRRPHEQVDLSPNDEELAQRAAEPEGDASGKPNG